MTYPNGELVYFDDTPGIVLDSREPEIKRSAHTLDYKVEWEGGYVSWVWGSDLMNEDERAELLDES